MKANLQGWINYKSQSNSFRKSFVHYKMAKELFFGGEIGQWVRENN